MGAMDFIAAPLALAGSALSYIGGERANKRNVALQRETNALNYQMFQENQGFQQMMFQKQLDAQDPAYLRRKLQEAGYNPASLVAGAQGMLGTSPSVSPTPPNAAVSPHVNDAVTPAMQVATAGINASADAINKLEEAKGKSIDNSFKEEHWKALIEKLIHDGFISKEQAEQLGWQNLLTQYQFDDLSKQAHQTVYKLNAEARLADANAAMQNWLRENKGPKEIEHINAQISNLAAQQKYFEAQEFATRAGVPATIASLYAAAHRDKTQGDLNESENAMTEPTKQMIGKLTKGDDLKSNFMKVLWLLLKNR